MANGVILGVACLIGGTIAPAAMGALVETGWSIPGILGLCACTYFLCILLSVFLRVEKYEPAAEQNARIALRER